MAVACEWLERCESSSGGWGWVSDVIPNPQNTAEIIVALCRAGRSANGFARHIELLSSTRLVWPDGRIWSFDTPLDWAWRLRGIALLPGGPGSSRDRQLGRCLRELRRQFTGRGWRLSPNAPESAFATSLALISISEAAPATADRFRASWRWLLTELRQPSNPECPVAHTSWALLAVTEPVFAPWRDAAYRRAVRAGVRRLLDLTHETVPTEEEAFTRSQIRDIWRHPNMAVVLQAVLRVDPRQLFDPGVRRLFWHLIENQRYDAEDKEFGAFALNSGGPVTTYSTSHGLETMVAVRTALGEASPADVLEKLCQIDGRHHSDAQEILRVPNRYPILLNSTAGLAFGILLTIPTASFLAVVLSGASIGDLGRKVIACGLACLLAIGWYGYLAARWPNTPNRNVALGIYGVITAVILPIVTYLVT
jgi:hypothetical protein